MGLYNESKGIILASRSDGRAKMLARAGIDFRTAPADIDERKIEQQMIQKNAAPEDIAAALSKEKALAVSNENKDHAVVGSDQVLFFQGELLHKSPSKNAALEKLKLLQQKPHELISSVCVAIEGRVVFHHADKAVMHMRALDADFLQHYAAVADNTLKNTVGAYAIEEEGAWLFERTEGDYFTIVGMPLLPLLGFLQREGWRP